MLEECSDPTHGRTEHEGGRIYLERRFFDDASIVKNESICILYNRVEIRGIILVLLNELSSKEDLTSEASEYV
jgi:hypothetical protein